MPWVQILTLPFTISVAMGDTVNWKDLSLLMLTNGNENSA